MLQNPSKEILYPDPEADDLQDLISSSLCTDTSLVKLNFSEDPFSTFYVKLLTNKQTKQTDRQTPGIL